MVTKPINPIKKRLVEKISVLKNEEETILWIQSQAKNDTKILHYLNQLTSNPHFKNHSKAKRIEQKLVKNLGGGAIKSAQDVILLLRKGFDPATVYLEAQKTLNYSEKQLTTIFYIASHKANYNIMWELKKFTAQKAEENSMFLIWDAVEYYIHPEDSKSETDKFLHSFSRLKNRYYATLILAGIVLTTIIIRLTIFSLELGIFKGDLFLLIHLIALSFFLLLSFPIHYKFNKKIQSYTKIALSFFLLLPFPIRYKFNKKIQSYTKSKIAEQNNWVFSQKGNIIYDDLCAYFAPLLRADYHTQLSDFIWISTNELQCEICDMHYKKDTETIFMVPLKEDSVSEKFYLRLSKPNSTNNNWNNLSLESITLQEALKCEYHFHKKISKDKIKALLTPVIQDKILKILEQEPEFSLFFSYDTVAFLTPYGLLEELKIKGWNHENVPKDTGDQFYLRASHISHLVSQIGASFRNINW